jgi:hypothetical protein
MTYFCFPGGWGCYDLNGVDEKTLVAEGAHGYATLAQAQAHVNASPTALQQATLQGLKAESMLPIGAGTSGDLSTPTSTGGVTGLIAKASAFMDDLTSGAFWLRLAEVVIGLLLIAVGVAELTHAVPIATKVAKTVGSTAALAAA